MGDPKIRRNSKINNLYETAGIIINTLRKASMSSVSKYPDKLEQDPETTNLNVKSEENNNLLNQNQKLNIPFEDSKQILIGDINNNYENSGNPTDSNSNNNFNNKQATTISNDVKNCDQKDLKSDRTSLISTDSYDYHIISSSNKSDKNTNEYNVYQKKRGAYSKSCSVNFKDDLANKLDNNSYDNNLTSDNKIKSFDNIEYSKNSDCKYSESGNLSNENYSEYGFNENKDGNKSISYSSYKLNISYSNNNDEEDKNETLPDEFNENTIKVVVDQCFDQLSKNKKLASPCIYVKHKQPKNQIKLIGINPIMPNMNADTNQITNEQQTNDKNKRCHSSNEITSKTSKNSNLISSNQSVYSLSKKPM